MEFRLKFPVAVRGSGNGGPYRYDLRRADTGDSLSNNTTALHGVSFDPNGRVLSGSLLTNSQGSSEVMLLRGKPVLSENPSPMQGSPAIYPLEYVVHDSGGNCSTFPFNLTTSGKWSKVFINTKYPWVAAGEEAVFVVRGGYAFNVPTVTLEITTTGDQGSRTTRDTVTIPVTVTEADSVEYAVPTTTGIDAVTVALVPQAGYVVSSFTWHTATVRVVDEVVRPVVTDAGSPNVQVPPGGTIVLRGSYRVDPPYETGTNDLVYYEWVQTSGPPAVLGRTGGRNLSVTIPNNTSPNEILDFKLTVSISSESAVDMDTGTDTVRISVASTTGASGSGGPRPEPQQASVAPTASAGPDLTGAPGESVTLQGINSENPYGEWWQMEHAWTQLSGPSVTLDEPTHGDPAFTVPSDAADGTVLEFQLTVTDKEGQSDSDTVTVTVQRPIDPEANTPPTFDESDSAIRSLAENTAAGENVGLPLTATDQESDALTYTLSGDAAESFEIDVATGQLTTVADVTYDYEAKQIYSVAVTAEDPDGATASISVTVNLTGVNDPPVFDQDSAAFAITENAAAGQNVGAPHGHRPGRGHAYLQPVRGGRRVL